MSQVLALNAAFQPISWLTPKDAVKCYAENQVLAELGDSVFTFQGGTGRNGHRSIIDANSIIVVKGKVLPYAGQRQFKLPKRGNHALFLRDQYCCAYCGETFAPLYLQREHVTPRAQKGRDVWENVVSACAVCNGRKRDRTPEQAKMPLLYLPYAPSPYEHMILRGRQVLADQMAFLLENVPKHRRLHA